MRGLLLTLGAVTLLAGAAFWWSRPPTPPDEGLLPVLDRTAPPRDGGAALGSVSNDVLAPSPLTPPVEARPFDGVGVHGAVFTLRLLRASGAAAEKAAFTLGSLGSSSPLNFRTDHRGECRVILDRVPDEAFVVHSPPEGFDPVPISAESMTAGFVTVSLRPSGTLSLRIQLPPGMEPEHVSGRVVARRWFPKGPLFERELQLAALEDQTIEVSPLPMHSEVHLDLKTSLGDRIAWFEGPDTDGERREVVYVLPSLAISGRLLGPDGRARRFTDGSVRLLRAGESVASISFRTDGDGGFFVGPSLNPDGSDVAFESVLVSIEDWSVEDVLREGCSQQVGVLRLGDLVMSSRRPLAEGIVVDQAGSPVEGVSVFERSAQDRPERRAIRTKADGRFLLYEQCAMSDAEFVLGVEGESLIFPEEIVCQRGARGLRIVGERGGTLVGAGVLEPRFSIVAKRNGEERVAPWLASEGFGSPGEWRKFRIELAAGHYALMARAPNGVVLTQPRDIEVVVGKTIDVGMIRPDRNVRRHRVIVKTLDGRRVRTFEILSEDGARCVARSEVYTAYPSQGLSSASTRGMAVTRGRSSMLRELAARDAALHAKNGVLTQMGNYAESPQSVAGEATLTIVAGDGPFFVVAPGFRPTEFSLRAGEELTEVIVAPGEETIVSVPPLAVPDGYRLSVALVADGGTMNSFLATVASPPIVDIAGDATLHFRTGSAGVGELIVFLEELPAPWDVARRITVHDPEWQRRRIPRANVELWRAQISPGGVVTLPLDQEAVDRAARK